jgi:hypothetical protein
MFSMAWHEYLPSNKQSAEKLFEKRLDFFAKWPKTCPIFFIFLFCPLLKILIIESN